MLSILIQLFLNRISVQSACVVLGLVGPDYMKVVIRSFSGFVIATFMFSGDLLKPRR